MLTTLVSKGRLGLFRTGSAPSSATNPLRRPQQPLQTRPKFNFEFQRLFRLPTRAYSSSNFEEGDADREEYVWKYFAKKPLDQVQKTQTKSQKHVSSKAPPKPIVKHANTNQQTPAATKISNIDKTITKEDADSRTDRFISRLYPKLPNSRINKLLRDKKIVVRHPESEGFRKVEGNERLKLGSVVRFKGQIETLEGREKSGSLVKESKVYISPERLEEVRSWVLYKDASLIVLNKPSNVAVQGGSGIKESLDDLCEALKYESSVKPKLVHRLDQGASGLLILARNRSSAQALTKSFASHEMNKLYWAVCIGTPKRLAGSVKVGLRKQILEGEDSERVFAVDPDTLSEDESPFGDKKDSSIKPSHSRYHTLAHTHNVLSLLALRPRTGRTHQLRVHCSQVLNTPIFGDYKYGPGCPEALTDLMDVKRGGHGVHLHLHAKEISFLHPETKKPVHFKAPLPPHMTKTMQQFDYHIMADEHQYASLTEEEKALKPYQFEFKEGPLKQKLRLNKVSKSTEYQKEKRREYSLQQRAASAPKNLRARISNQKKQGSFSTSTFKSKKKVDAMKKRQSNSKRTNRR